MNRGPIPSCTLPGARHYFQNLRMVRNVVFVTVKAPQGVPSQKVTIVRPVNATAYEVAYRRGVRMVTERNVCVFLGHTGEPEGGTDA